MHFKNVDDAIAAYDPSKLESDETAECVRGCYRCLLSYYNQPDHETIDRTNEEAKRLLVQIARGTIEVKTAPTGSDPWQDAFDKADLPAPDADRRTFGGVAIPYAWKSYYVAAHVGPLPNEAKQQAEQGGWLLVELPTNPAAGVPEALLLQLKGKA
jgi:hypothetical protein